MIGVELSTCRRSKEIEETVIVCCEIIFTFENCVKK
jgi:hypothetical protein